MELESEPKYMSLKKKTLELGLNWKSTTSLWSGLVRTKPDQQFVFKELDLEHDSWF
jgi:hypothetical protein